MAVVKEAVIKDSVEFSVRGVPHFLYLGDLYCSLNATVLTEEEIDSAVENGDEDLLRVTKS